MKVDKSIWQKRRLADFFNLQMGKTPPRGELSLWKNGNVTWVSISDMKNKRYISESKEQLPMSTVNSYNIPIIPVGTVIMSFKLTIGKTCIVAKPLTTNEAIMAFYPKEDVEVKSSFLAYALSALKWKGNRAVKGVTINKKTISQKEFSLPPIAEQESIAAELDALQEVIDGYREQLADLDALAQSIFLDTFGDPVSNPKGWEVKKLKSSCEKITDGTHGTPKRQTKGRPFITGKHIRPFSIDYLNCDYVTEDDHQEIFKRCNPQKGDVLYTNIGAGVGTAAINTVEYEFSMKNVALLKPGKDIMGVILQYILNSKSFTSLTLPSFLAGGAQSFLSLKQIGLLPIILPPIELQRQFAKQVKAIEKQKDLLRQQLADAEMLMAERMQYYFS